MPEYLAPGVFVEETSFRSKVIEGVSTTTTAFVGPTRYGPIDLRPEVVTSLFEYERTYGGGAQLEHGTTPVHNYMWHAARAFFAEGGKRLYVSRIFRQSETGDGHATATVSGTLDVRARYPGKAGKLRIRFTLRTGPNVLLGVDGTVPRIGALVHNDVVLIQDPGGPRPGTPGASGAFYLATIDASGAWSFTPSTAASAITQWHSDFVVRVVTVTVSIDAPSDVSFGTLVYSDLALHPAHQRSGAPDSLTEFFANKPDDPEYGRQLPIVIDSGTATTGPAIVGLFTAARATLLESLRAEHSTDDERSVVVTLDHDGDDGSVPEPEDYEGRGDLTSTARTGLKALEELEDVSIVAAPGATRQYSAQADHANSVIGHLIAHATRTRYRIAVIDSGEGQAPADVRALRARFDSSYAALYYPWVRVLDPITGVPVLLPPSGFVAGIYARNDVNRAVYKAPANEIVNLALGFEQSLSAAHQEILNPAGINCFRSFEGRGHRLWGARTMSSDGEWKYVNVRRYFAYLERSLDRGTQWAVFEPNGEALWTSVRRTIEDFLFNEWSTGALLGDKPDKAYFVKCDRSTMTQNDLDNGRLVCVVGLAVLKPAEFVIIRVGQWTGDRRN